MRLISTTDELASFCSSLASASFVTVDTEFMRERTYWPQLCLVQLGGPDDAAAVDAQAEGIDLEPLYALMRDRKVLKVFHAARQDLEIFLKSMGELPQPIFDTQVTAMVCGFGDQAAYDTLAAKLAKAHIDKSSRFTDWSR
ncbi:MAG: ribonuclease D, partial [Rhodospirillales bacterium]